MIFWVKSFPLFGLSTQNTTGINSIRIKSEHNLTTAGKVSAEAELQTDYSILCMVQVSVYPELPPPPQYFTNSSGTSAVLFASATENRQASLTSEDY